MGRVFFITCSLTWRRRHGPGLYENNFTPHCFKIISFIKSLCKIMFSDIKSLTYTHLQVHIRHAPLSAHITSPYVHPPPTQRKTPTHSSPNFPQHKSAAMQCSMQCTINRFLTVFSSADNLSTDVWLPGLARLFEIPSCNLIFVVETLVYMQKRSSPVSQDLSWFYVEESCSSWLGNTSKSLNLKSLKSLDLHENFAKFEEGWSQWFN